MSTTHLRAASQIQCLTKGPDLICFYFTVTINKKLENKATFSSFLKFHLLFTISTNTNFTHVMKYCVKFDEPETMYNESF